MNAKEENSVEWDIRNLAWATQIWESFWLDGNFQKVRIWFPAVSPAPKLSLKLIKYLLNELDDI